VAGEGRANRLRGFQFERDCVNDARALGLEAERMWGSNGASQGLDPGVDLLIEEIPLQAKRMKTLSKKYIPDAGAGVVGQVFRQDRDIPYVTLEWQSFLLLVQELKQLRGTLEAQ
jgi:hypothetical protein